MARATLRSPRNRAEVLVAISTGVLSLSEVLSLAASSVGGDVRALPLREVLSNLPGVDARAVLARLSTFGFPSPNTIRLGELLINSRLSILADVILVDLRTPPVEEWPFTTGGT